MKAIYLWSVLITFATAMVFAGEDQAAPAVRIAKFSGDCAAAISYTFDDGLRDQFTAAVPMLNQIGFKGTFFIIAGKVSETVEDAEQRKNDKRAWGTITWDELKSMDAQGHEIASHTWSHPNLTKLSPVEVEMELSKPCDAIQTRIGKAPLTLAFPFNASTPEIKEAALKHYLACRTQQIGTGGDTTAASLDAWADKLAAEKEWGVVMAHAITNGYAAMSSAEVLRGHWKYVKSRERDIWVDTFANVARYEKERDEAKLTIVGKTGDVSCTLTSALDPQLYDVPLTLVVHAPGASSVHAERAGRELPVSVGGDAILVQAIPGAQPITITWKLSVEEDNFSQRCARRH
jgi:peptidoglycan/xylan/chitin deacetylase (PgdA/CDA1 family)